MSHIVVFDPRYLMLPFHSAGGNTDELEELSNWWMQLAALTPFFRNHNVRGAISKEPSVMGWHCARYPRSHRSALRSTPAGLN